MTYKEFPPPPALSQVVKSFWIFEANGLPNQSAVVRLMPFSCPRFVFHYKNQFYNRLNNTNGTVVPDSILNGHSGKYREYTVNGDFGLVGVYLYPYAPATLFQLPANEYFNQEISLQSIITSADFRILEDQVYNAPNNHIRINLLTSFLLDRLKRADSKAQPFNKIIKDIVNTDSAVTVNQLSAQYGISVKQLERKFVASVGLTPKAFSRITRFERTVNRIQTYERLTNLALDEGYYDQAHFNHEFRHFSGYTPSSLYEDGSQLMAHVCVRV